MSVLKVGRLMHSCMRLGRELAVKFCSHVEKCACKIGLKTVPVTICLSVCGEHVLRKMTGHSVGDEALEASAEIQSIASKQCLQKKACSDED